MVSKRDNISWIPAIWNAPGRVKAGVTTRRGGYSTPPCATLNLATHTGDNPETVAANRQLLMERLDLPSAPVWLEQVHGNRIICADSADTRTADGAYTDRPGIVCTVMTADCVPVLLCNADGTRVAAVHIGWKGYCANIITHALQLFHPPLSGLHVWIGPHIRADNYEVGDDMRNACLAQNAELSTAFVRNRRGRWQADLEFMVRQQFLTNGVRNISSIGLCTWAEPDLFYSYRRDGQTGRMASMIWIDKST
jgi:YfiH family protein